MDAKMAGKKTNLNYYEILGVTRESSEKDIIKSYRKKALICHPDKNPDNPKAADLFHELSEALKVLTDKKAKAAYDAVIKARELAKLRTQALDAKRKKFKLDLEAREASAQREKAEDSKAKINLEEEIKRLREQGSNLLKEQQEIIQTQLEKEKKENKDEIITPKLKVKWKTRKDDNDNGGYSEEILQNIFEKYGHVIAVIVSLKKNGIGIVEFQNPSQAMIAMEFENGLEENPLTISWLQGRQTDTNPPNDKPESGTKASRTKSTQEENEEQNQPSAHDNDFESMVLMRMKMAHKNQDKTFTMLKDPT